MFGPNVQLERKGLASKIVRNGTFCCAPCSATLKRVSRLGSFSALNGGAWLPHCRCPHRQCGVPGILFSGSGLREGCTQASSARCHLSALLERVAEARGTSGPINAKGGSSYSVALREVGGPFGHGLARVKKWPPRRAAEVELIEIKEFTFQPLQPGCQAWHPSGRSPLRSFHGRDYPAQRAAPSHLRGPRR